MVLDDDDAVTDAVVSVAGATFWFGGVDTVGGGPDVTPMKSDRVVSTENESNPTASAVFEYLPMNTWENVNAVPTFADVFKYTLSTGVVELPT
jgi:hypothetical protein